jgi:O-succinylbenzoic acid--CoA ligase
MTRPLRVVPPQPRVVLEALRDALSGKGPAAFVTESPSSVPDAVSNGVALVVETSGSTARPKRVALSRDALLASAAASASAIGGDGQWLLALPTHYIAGLNVLVRSIASRTDPVMVPEGPFDPVAFTRAADSMDADVRFTSLVPAQLARLLDAPDALPALRRFDRILVGGQSTPQKQMDRAAELHVAITRTYGSSETCGGCVYDGIPIGNTRIRVANEQIEITGAVLADGYLDDNARTAETFVVEEGTRWYRTGDAGDIVDGELRVTGRLDDTIISGGIKVSLAEVERVVRHIAGQADAVVVAVASDRWGEVPVVITTTPIELAELRAKVRSHLDDAAAPDRVILVEHIPVLRTGKPDRIGLQRLAQ